MLKLLLPLAIFLASCAGGEFTTAAGKPFASRLVYSGSLRPLTLTSRIMLSSYFGVPSDFPTLEMKYRYEVGVEREGREEWIPARGDLIEKMQSGLQPGQEFSARLRFLGQRGARKIYLLEAFTAGSRTP